MLNMCFCRTWFVYNFRTLMPSVYTKQVGYIMIKKGSSNMLFKMIPIWLPNGFLHDVHHESLSISEMVPIGLTKWASQFSIDSHMSSSMIIWMIFKLLYGLSQALVLHVYAQLFIYDVQHDSYRLSKWFLSCFSSTWCLYDVKPYSYHICKKMIPIGINMIHIGFPNDSDRFS